MNWLRIIALTTGCVIVCAGLRPSSVQAKTYVDDRDTNHQIVHPPKRVVSLSPVSTELMYAIGAGGRLVGRTTHCDYPQKARAVPSVGSLFPPDYERILAQSPDLILMSDGNLATRSRLESLGLVVFVIHPRRVADVGVMMRRLGQIMGTGQVARRAADTFDQTLVALRVEATHRPLVLYEVWGNPLTTAGPSTFLADIIQTAGGQNIVRAGTDDWPKVSPEWAIAANPAIILTPRTDSHRAWLDGERPGWGATFAVQRRQVFKVPDEATFVRPGPRVLSAIRWLRDTIKKTREPTQ